jgi:hypothetical protein
MRKEVNKEGLQDGYIWGNVDNTKQLPKKYLDHYHVYAEKRSIDPRNPTYPIIRSRIICFHPNQYRLYFGSGSDKQIHFCQVMGITNTSLVWDPTLPGARELHESIIGQEGPNPDLEFEKRLKLRNKPVTFGDIYDGRV